MQLKIVKIRKDIVSKDEVYNDAVCKGKISSSDVISPEEFSKLSKEYAEWQNDPRRYIKVVVNDSKTKTRLPFQIKGIRGACNKSDTLYFNRVEQAIKAFKKIITLTNNNHVLLLINGEGFTDLAEVQELEKRLKLA